MHGNDISPLLKDPAAPWPHVTFYEYSGEHYGSDMRKIVNETPKKATYHDVPWYVVAREDRWKFIHYLQPGQIEELYDLQNDPEELVNVAGKAENMEVIVRLRGWLNTELKRTDAGFAISGTK